MTQISELGRTRLYTRRQRRRIRFAVFLGLTGGIGAVAMGAGAASWLTGAWQWPTLESRSIREDGQPLLSMGSDGQGSEVALRFPVMIDWPEMDSAVAIIIAASLWAGWFWFVLRPLARGLSRQTRHRGLARKRSIQRSLGARAARRAGRFTRPGLTRRQRFLLPTRAFGFRLIRPTTPKSRRRVWADWEQRIRIIARTGWGKGARLLIPIIRALPGPALVSSTEPTIFSQTVLARTNRPDLCRWSWLRFLTGKTGRRRTYAVWVVDFSDPSARWAAGYPQVRWNPIPACVDHTIAHRRAEALVTGVGTNSDRGSDSDRFFRSSASEVLAAWLHSAALGGRGIDDLLEWMRHPDDPTPTRILEDHLDDADPSAVLNLATHLDTRASKTTSGVLRYLALALNSVATADGRALCTTDPDDPVRFDMKATIEAGGTVYVLADPNRIDRARPLLSLFAAEMFMAAEAVALRKAGKRLSVPFIAVLDELRYGVTVPNLPYVASSQRKYGIGFVYSVQSSTQEEAVFGKDAAALRDAAGVTIVGGIDINLAKELSDRAGTTTVVTSSRGTSNRSEHTERQDTLSIADQQNLDDGHAVVLARGLAPFIGRAASLYDHGRLRQRIRREEAQVSARVAASNAVGRCQDHQALAARGAGFTISIRKDLP